MTVRAVYENGVFRPLGAVELPESCEVEFEPKVIPPDDVEAHRQRLFELLSQTFDTGDPYLAARHNEHQP